MGMRVSVILEVTVDKDESYQSQLPREHGASTDPDGNQQEEAELQPKWLQVPKLSLRSKRKQDEYQHEEFKGEPNKYDTVANRPRRRKSRLPKYFKLKSSSTTRGSKRRRKKSKTVAKNKRRVMTSDATKISEQRHHLSPAPRRHSRHQHHRREQGLFKLIILILLVGLALFAYSNRSMLQVFIAPLAEKIAAQVDQVQKQAQATGDSGITSSDYDLSTATPSIYKTLLKLDCYELMQRVQRLQNVYELSFQERLAVAECFYLQGDYRNSYLLLEKNTAQLHDESLLLFTILLLKRKQFSTVTELLQGQCADASMASSFFPCLAQSLLYLSQSDRIIPIDLQGIHQDNPYSAIALLLLALHHGDYSIASDYLVRATRLGMQGKRRVALSYIYDVLVRYAYRHGDASQVREVQTAADKNLSDEPVAALWWVRFIARLKNNKDRKKEILRSFSGRDGYSRMYDNLDFINIVGRESIISGYSDVLSNILDAVSKYQKRMWNADAKGMLQHLEQWRIRIMIARNDNREVLKKLQSYAKKFHKDHFYYFFKGVIMLHTMGRSNVKSSSSAFLLRSLSMRNAWDNNYAYALALLRGGKATTLARHMRKLKQMTTTASHKNWLFLLKTEARISSGKLDMAIAGLRSYISKHPQSFVAHRLLTVAYTRAGQQKEAIVVRKVYDLLQTRVPYYSTEEGINSPLGAFALLY